MIRFRDCSIRIKLTTAIVLTSVLTLALASVAFIINDRESYRSELIQNVSLMAQIISDNSSSAVAFEDDASALEVLMASSRDEHIMWAVIETPDEKSFASFVRKGESSPSSFPQVPQDGILFEDKYVTVKKDITDGDNSIGSLWIRSDLKKVQARTAWFLGISGIVLLAGTIVGLIVAYFFQRSLSRPIEELKSCAELLAGGNPEFTVEYKSKDELGRLADTFRSLQGYLRELSGYARRIADGDLTSHVKPKSAEDALGNSFKFMNANLTSMVKQLDISAKSLVCAATDISTSAEKMNEGARNQTDNVRQVATAINEMTATIMESSKNAGEASDASRIQSTTATKGGDIVKSTIDGMNTISSVVKGSADSIGKLAASAEQIGSIIEVIEDIANQTNLLALNAAIEAARAGEHGRGFAVVADEVRKLAERTGKATGEITGVITEIQDKATNAVQGMEVGIAEVEKGRGLTDEAGNSLVEIENMSHQVMSMIEQIATAAEQQSQVAENVSERVEIISKVTDDTAMQANDSAEISLNMNKQAEDLQKIVAGFKVN
ncbi:MAG: HAMP domain-containing protein [candidate division Zixibacteria bacterium]|nr:HAMP domain-containing protein [candidate division Zixibacteria bacterium]